MWPKTIIVDGLPLFKSFIVSFQDDEGKTGPFLDEIKKFMKEEKERYVSEIKTQLDNKR